MLRELHQRNINEKSTKDIGQRKVRWKAWHKFFFDTITFKDDDDYENEMYFARKTSFLFIPPEKLTLLLLVREFKPSSDPSNSWCLVPATTSFSLKPVVEWRRLLRFPTKMKPAHHVLAPLSFVKISISLSYSSENLKVSLISFIKPGINHFKKICQKISESTSTVSKGNLWFSGSL